MHGTLETSRRAQSDAEKRPSRGEAEQAVRTLIRWAGEHPEREGLFETPARVVRAYEEWFEGYDQDPVEILQRTFEDVGGYDEIVVLYQPALRIMHWPNRTPITGSGPDWVSLRAGWYYAIFRSS